ncbi:hypothetical protein ZIOFF_027382 [Zingiber officinale]|uniref:Uncharacterized protein n=1 Tax=Zingiber officinale TaxID=94328 RepID=A0A8J5L2Q9_ZINOF|nr:hypothetical protein ZIOFF_027382 [Zingiber officinale]
MRGGDAASGVGHGECEKEGGDASDRCRGAALADESGRRRDPAYNSLPSEEDWKKVHLVCAFLEEFNEVSHIISGSQYPTSNLFLLELYNIKKLLNDTKVGEAVLDLRNKMKLIEWCFPEIYSEVDAIEHIVTVHETYLLYSEYVEVHRTDIAEKDVQEQVKSELEVYLEEGVVFCEVDHEFDALSWWKMNNLKFRIL